jgi:HSP20 family molecular chaperone IbpA
VEKLLRELNNLLQMAGDAKRLRGSAGHARRIFDMSVRVGPLATTSAIDVTPIRDASVDVFDENDHYRVVAELSGVREGDVEWSVGDDRHVAIRIRRGDGRRDIKTIELDSAIDGGTAVSCYENGILELRLWKLQRR